MKAASSNILTDTNKTTNQAKYITANNWKYDKSEKYYINDLDLYLVEKLLEFGDMYRKRLCANLVISEFILMRTIGAGSTGRIILARKKGDNSSGHVAMKITSKEQIVKKGTIMHARSEKRILQSLSFPFVINLITFFHDNSYLYFVLPFEQGGDMFTLIRSLSRLSEDEARFYSAQIVLALEYLNYIGVVHRDLKPENILLSSSGYLKLADFGMAKVLPAAGRAYTLCGTCEYLAPEVIEEKGYGQSADWWSLGILIYEMCAGYSPFRSLDVLETFKNITNCKYELPQDFSVELKELISKLLQCDISKRIGCTWSGVSEVKKASWFKRIHWLQILNKRLQPPYIPLLRGEFDDSLFENYPNDRLTVSIQDTYKEHFSDFL
ncbi:hypothetical protein O3M35_011217 [Rhynocoris fuscipes]|uniref:Uncharacterized protein n=1 Tax=Rhynocoris fuscipes TaxID=488301 RepID=A0AAW1CY13_9HEMI